MEIKVHVRTNCPEAKIEKGEIWKVSLTSKPVGGEANRELIKLLEKELKAKVKIIRGKTSRKKLIQIY